MNLILLGAPGAGKGTQGEIIRERFGIPEVSTGVMLREAIKAGTPMGLKAKEVIDHGDLVPDQVVNAIVEERLKSEDCRKGFILDGYPRTLPQAQALDAMGVRIDKVLYIHVDDEVIVERLGNRRVCEDCGATYHLINQPSAAGELCEKCGGRLVMRKDDAPETIRERLDTYHQLTEPLVEYYRGQGKLWQIDGSTTIEATTEETLKILEDGE
jgi:adenylate kinase